MRLFDAGDSSQSGTFTMRPLDPDGNPVGSCQHRAYSTTEDPTSGTVRGHNRSGTTSLYNHRWLDIDIDIDVPLSYTCANCWWSVDYSLRAGASFYEWAVWTVLIVGDPVHLLE
jgi:hypothetical protein